MSPFILHSDLSLVYPDMAELKSLLTGLTLPRQNQSDSADVGTTSTPEPGSVSIRSQGGGFTHAQLQPFLKRMRAGVLSEGAPVCCVQCRFMWCCSPFLSVVFIYSVACLLRAVSFYVGLFSVLEHCFCLLCCLFVACSAVLCRAIFCSRVLFLYIVLFFLL